VSEVDIGRGFDGHGREGFAVSQIPRLDSVAASREDNAIGDRGGRERIGFGVSAGDAFGLSGPEQCSGRSAQGEDDIAGGGDNGVSGYGRGRNDIADIFGDEVGLVFPEFLAGGGIDGPERSAGGLGAVVLTPAEVEAIAGESDAGGGQSGSSEAQVKRQTRAPVTAL